MLPNRVITADDERDRRRRPRLRLAYSLRLRRTGETVEVIARTEDVSCDGFYCIAQRPFLPREWLECELVIPGDELGYASGISLVLRCHAEVVRIVPVGLKSECGLACRLEDYTIGLRPIGESMLSAVSVEAQQPLP